MISLSFVLRPAGEQITISEEDVLMAKKVKLGIFMKKTSTRCNFKNNLKFSQNAHAAPHHP